MQMDEKKPRGLLKHSIVLIDLMTGEDKMDYIGRMWDLYFKVYQNPRALKKKSKKFLLDKEKAYELCSQLTKIFGH